MLLVTTTNTHVAHANYHHGETFHKHNNYKSWCPYAICNNSPMCQPCRRRFVIVLTTARGGSTTVMKMLDQLPHIRMSGEESNHLGHAYVATNRLVNHMVLRNAAKWNKRVEGPWQRNPIPKGAFACPNQLMMETLTPPSESVMADPQQYQEDYQNTIVGFKTVTFHQNNFSAAEGASFLRDMFPCSRIVVNIRSDVQAQQKSAKKFLRSTSDVYKKSFADINKMLQNNEFLQEVAQHLGQQQAKLINMTEWSKPDNVTGLHVFDELAEWLGYSDCRFPRMITEHKEITHFDLGPHCRLN